MDLALDGHETVTVTENDESATVHLDHGRATD
jgi:hypothetical protein